MDREATKTRGEREDEEVERLVRPSPKVKPPRHDRRRETVEVDEDPDLDAKDKDLSKNFKDIGGSVARRVLMRWGAAPAPVPKKAPPKPPPPAGPGAKPPPKPPGAPKPPGGAKPKPKPKRIKVRIKDTGQVVWIGENTLKEDPGGYEVVDEKEDTKGAPPKAPATPTPTQQPKAPAQAEPAQGNVEKDMAARNALLNLAKEDPGFESFLKSFRNPDSDIAQFAKNNPGFNAEPFMKGKQLPEGIKTIGDLARVVTLQGKAPKPKKVPKQKPGPETQQPAAPPEAPPPAPAAAPAPQQPAQPQGAPPTPAPAAPAPAAPAGQPGTAPPSSAAPAPPPAQPQAPPELKYQAPGPEDQKDRAARNEMEALLKQNPELQQALKELAKPKSQVAQDAQKNPKYSAADYFKSVLKGAKLPADINSLEDLQRVMALAPEPKEKKAPKDTKGEKGKPKQPAEPTFAPFQPDRKVSASERQASDRLIMRSFPKELAAKLLMATPRYHPDEVQALVSDYNLAKSMPVPRDLSSVVDKVSKFYSTDPNTVRPPKTVKADDGSVVDFKSMTDPVEQAKALRRHQVQTVAMSLAAQTAIASSLEKNSGAPKDLAPVMSNFMLSNRGETPTERNKRASEQAENMFFEGLRSKPDEGPPLSDSVVKRLLKASDDLAVQKLVVGYCQAKDYRDARKLFLGKKAKDEISEWQTPEMIAKRLGKATDYLRKKSARYPAGTTSQETYSTFRDRVMKHLGNLSPIRHEAVQKLLDVKDNQQYDHELKQYEKAAKQYKKEVERTTKEWQKDYAAYSRMLREHGNLNADPPVSTQDRLLERKIAAPKPPVKPPNYDLLTKKPDELEEDSSDLWDDFATRTASDRHVANRVAGRHAFSIYSATCAMDRSAVYWGVAPYPKRHEGFEPYRHWEQPQARDLGEPDYSRVLMAARKWLSAPVLSTNIQGVVRDTQLRAALDLALRAENYDHAIHPTLYNKLLARLAGVSEDKTLLTVRSKAARNTMSNKKVELETTQADRFLARLDRIASVVQSNQKKWERGMSFEDAKRLVNAIDKLADDVELATYGADSLLNRQASEIGHARLAEVLERDSDEKYMDTFKNPMAPHQTEADEPYMSAYKDDQSSGVHHGKSTTGRPLAP